jgi:hypothetical protein
MTAEAGLARVLSAAGGPAFRDELARFERFGERACDLVLAVVTGELHLPAGVPGANPRAVWEDVEDVITAAAARWPRRFVRGVRANPELRENFGVMWALGWAEHSGAGELLLEGVRIRRAGLGFTRWAALNSLVRLAHPALPDELVRLVRDRHGMTRSTAVSAAIGYGDGRLIADLLRLARNERTPPGERDNAWDAIEAIAVREGLADPPLGPDGPRLVAVRRPAGAADATVESVGPTWLGVHRGQRLAVLAADGRRRTVRAPCDGVVVSHLLTVGRKAPPIVAWIRTDGAAERTAPLSRS